MLTARQRTAALTIILATSTATGALAQATGADPDSPEVGATEAAPSEDAGAAVDQAQDEQPDEPGMMSEPRDQSTMGSGMMSQGMMCSEMCSGMRDQGAAEQGRAGPSRMDHSAMGSGARSDIRQPGMMNAEMHGHMIKIVFALADADGNGGLSLDELATIQTRMFGAVDADKDGNVTPEELQAFIRE